MAANSTRSTLSRQWELLKLLPSRGPGLTASQITEKLKNDHGVNKRTVERDLQELSRLFPLQCNDQGKPYGWHWRPGAQLELPGIEPATKIALICTNDEFDNAKVREMNCGNAEGVDGINTPHANMSSTERILKVLPDQTRINGHV